MSCQHTTRPVWNGSKPALRDLTPADLLALVSNGPGLRKIAHNTWAVRTADGVGVMFHQTLILNFHADGTFTARSGGYRTVTTKQRLNALLPPGYRVFARDFAWHISTPEGTFPFTEGDRWPA